MVFETKLKGCEKEWVKSLRRLSRRDVTFEVLEGGGMVIEKTDRRML